MSFGGFPVTINSPRQESAVIKWVMNDLISREDVILAGGNADATYEIGTVIGQVTQGAQTVGAASPGGSNAGNGVVTEANPAADPLALAGTWVVELFAPATNAGWLTVKRPDGTIDGFGKVGVAYTGGIKFTLADGSADFASGDTFTVAVSYAAGSNKYVPVNFSATDGSQNAVGILFSRAFVPANTDTDGGAVLRFAAVLSDTLIWPSGATTNQIAAALVQLKAKHIYAKAQV